MNDAAYDTSLSARGIDIALSGKPIVRNATIRAAAGAVTVILGPNGSGKTTLLRALSGEIGATGEIAYNGKPLKAMKPWQLAACRAVLPQSSTLAFPYTVREIVRLGCMNGDEGNSRANRVDEALERVDLAGFAGRFYQDLSGGEQQRVQLARVLCQVWRPVTDEGPRYLLLDEPVSSLDIRHQIAIMDLARAFAEAGGGVLAILHDLNLAAMFADSVVIMKVGRTVTGGTPAQVLRDDVLADAFGCALRVNTPPEDGAHYVLPHSARQDVLR